MRVHDSVYTQVEALADERGITMKEAIRDVFKEAGYDV
jgi:antitoxin component of RelBE/YafQ-DinJ toxin-antitoxin module